MNSLDEACHRHNVADEIEAEICIDRVDRSDEEERVAIGRRMHHRLRSKVAGCARPVLDDLANSRECRANFCERDMAPRDGTGWLGM
jgi:hypothetical protein